MDQIKEDYRRAHVDAATMAALEYAAPYIMSILSAFTEAEFVAMSARLAGLESGQSITWKRRKAHWHKRMPARPTTPSQPPD